MLVHDAVAVFTHELTPTGKLVPFVRQELDQAATMLAQGQAARIVICGSHPLKGTFRGVTEAAVAEAYLLEQHPFCRGYILKEEQSTSIPENWLFMKVRFPWLHDVHIVTLAPLLRRVWFLGDWIYGDDARLSFTTLETTATFPLELERTQDAQCTMMRQGMGRGQHELLLRPDGSSYWDEWRREHHSCPYRSPVPRLHFS